MKLTNTEYQDLVSKTESKSPTIKNCCFAFLFGGGICTFAEFIAFLFGKAGLDQVNARAAASISLIAITAILTGLKVFDNIAKIAGAGTIVPITGFANAMVSPAIEFKAEGHVLGIGAKMFIIAGPVLVFGITSSIVYGLILWIFKLF